MRVLHLYAGNLYGGIERMLVTLAAQRHLAEQLLPEFALCFAGRLSQELQSNGVPVHQLHPVRMSRPWTVWHARRRLAELLRSRTYDVVITHALWPHAVLAAEVRKQGLKLVSFFHDVIQNPTWVDRWASRTRPDFVLANSRFTAQYVKNVFPTTPIEVLYPPVETKVLTGVDRNAVRQELSTDAKSLVIIQASRLERWKGPHVLIETLGKLTHLGNWTCWFVGGPQKPGEREYYAEMQKRANELGISDRIRFLGQRTDVARLMASADIYCQLNTGPEPYGVAFVEALMAGLPVVTTNIGGGAELIDDTCGVLVNTSDSDAARSALELMFTDENHRQKLSLGTCQRT